MSYPVRGDECRPFWVIMHQIEIHLWSARRLARGQVPAAVSVVTWKEGKEGRKLDGQLTGPFLYSRQYETCSLEHGRPISYDLAYERRAVNVSSISTSTPEIG